MDPLLHIERQGPSAIEDLYKQYKIDPTSLDKSWQLFFQGFELARANEAGIDKSLSAQDLDKEFAITNLIHGYRQRGHLFTKTNPVRTRRSYTPTLDIENFGLEANDLEAVFQVGHQIGIGPAKLKDIIAHLKATYCQSVGVEYVYIRHPEIVQWLQQKMEASQNSMEFTDQKRKHIFYHLKLAVGFEHFIHRKFVGHKRFSLEGAENLIPALDAIIEKGAVLGIKECVIGMSHRGRLNVLANILNKPYEAVFREFNGKEYDERFFSGDVKYHLGFENVVATDHGHKVRLGLMPNPSHLESVTPLVQGISRSKIDSVYKGDYSKLAPIIIHGDAAIAAQGVVYEVIQMSQLKGYKTGGTIHLVINNQVGFTTNYLDGRSSTYCTDVAKVTRSPIFHVNGDDVEALIYTIQLAMEFRQKFHSDVCIDILCYRKYGHNEADEPRFTQPMLYNIIEKHPNPRDIYVEKLETLEIMHKHEAKEEITQFNQLLEEKFTIAQQTGKLHLKSLLVEEYNDFELPVNKVIEKSIHTSIAKERLIKIAEKVNTLPENKNFFKKIEKIVSDRHRMLRHGTIDWGMAELLAYGSLLEEGHPVRISGQDCERGTFAHRHASFVLEDMNEKYFPLKHISNKQAPFHIYNSPLSEYGILGFEYGYALAQPNALTIWEAQFGDFSNVAQVIIDQYIASAAEKWGLMNNLVLFLPHGYEGQGPEHSSARMERFLNLAAHNNIQLIVPTTPANLFHLLRRQLKWKYRFPLIVFTPKSLLRHPHTFSTLDQLTKGQFQEVIDDKNAQANAVQKIIFCAGKLYYDLWKYRKENRLQHIVLIRIEQLYPFPRLGIQKILTKYNQAKELLWVQDEPENMGAGGFISKHIQRIKIIARQESASPAVGLFEVHNKELKEMLQKVFHTPAMTEIV
jgi:2-oxoglutarate dehydrogenase E1 component